MAPDLRSLNPLKKLVADTVFNAVSSLVTMDGPNIADVRIRRLSDLRTEVEITRRVNSADLPPRQFTVLVVEHR